jgi:hypothetical protein
VNWQHITSYEQNVERPFEAKVTMFQCLPFLLLARYRETKLSSKNWGVCGWAGNPTKGKQNTHKQRRKALDIGGSNDKGTKNERKALEIFGIQDVRSKHNTGSNIFLTLRRHIYIWSTHS